MVRLDRTVRFATGPEGLEGPRGNSYAGNPGPAGLGRFDEFTASFRGEADPTTGYLIDIAQADAALRAAVLPLVARAFRDRPRTDPASLMPELVDALARAVGPRLAGLAWAPTPYHALEMSTEHPAVVIIRERFDFAASHRLHVPALSDAENRRLFGKCNNAAGHGHNYRVEPAVAVSAPGASPPRFTLADLRRLVDETILSRFDHAHLNEDTAEFATGRGLNPSVENIARVFFDLLSPAVAGAGGDLRSITVWETDRTSATYPG